MTANDETYRIAGNRTGVLLISDFGASPSNLHDIANGLARAGSTIVCPRLTNQSGALTACEAALNELRARCDTVIVVGLSASTNLSLMLAAKHPGKVDGVALLAPVISRENGRIPWYGSIFARRPSSEFRHLVTAINQPAFVIQHRTGNDADFDTAAYLQNNLASTVEVAVLDMTHQNDLIIERTLSFIDRAARKIIKPAQQVASLRAPAIASLSWLPSLQPSAA